MTFPWTLDQVKAAFAGTGIDVLAELGQGNFKVAYRANTSGGVVALKIVRPQYSGSPSFSERISRELLAMRAVKSPYLVELYSASSTLIETQLSVYWTEEYVPGQNLSEVISRGVLGCDTSISIAKGINQAIGALWSRQIVHRDIKPDNIRVRDDGTPKLLDLGIARHVSLPSQTADHAATGPGTPMYRAPEQIKNQKRLITERTDQFALGIVVYQMLTNRYPFAVDPMALTVDDVHEAILTVNPKAPSTINALVTPGLDAVVLRMLGKSPSDRFRTSKMLEDALAAL